MEHLSECLGRRKLTRMIAGFVYVESTLGYDEVQSKMSVILESMLDPLEQFLRYETRSD